MSQPLTIVLLADASNHENEGRVLHALLYAKQAHEAGVETELIFDGGGAEWAAKLPEHPHFKDLYDELVKLGVIAGVCTFCAGAFGVKEELDAQGAHMIDDTAGHPNIGVKIANGRTVLTL